MRKTQWFTGSILVTGVTALGCGTSVEEEVFSVPPSAFVAAARDAYGEPREEPGEFSVCLSPRLRAPGSPLISPRVRHALEDDGWSFYDDELPTGDGVILLTFSQPERAGDFILLPVRLSANIVHSDGREVGGSIWDWEYQIGCFEGECTVGRGSTYSHGQGPPGNPSKVLAGQVGECIGPNLSPKEAADGHRGRSQKSPVA